MIFVTVGTQLSFDRMIKAIDSWAGRNVDVPIFAQIGPTEFKPAHLEAQDFISPSEANRYFQEASLIVSHAGMGSILTAMTYRKPILIMPRKAVYGEHRNDHQMATAKWLGDRDGVFVSEDENELPLMLDRRLELSGGGQISDAAQPALIDAVKQFVWS